RNRMIELRHASGVRMRVRVDQTRQDCLASQVHKAGLVSFGFEQVGAGAHTKDAVAPDRQGLVHRKMVVSGNDLAVMQNQIRFICERTLPWTAEQHADMEEPSSAAMSHEQTLALTRTHLLKLFPSDFSGKKVPLRW